jgi:hypothetical protein
VGAFVQAPTLATSVCPSWGVPPIVGGVVFAGRGDRETTSAVGAEVAGLEPKVLPARTSTWMVAPMSPLSSR